MLTATTSDSEEAFGNSPRVVDPGSAIAKPLPAPLAFDQGEEMGTIWQLKPWWPHEEPELSLLEQYWSESMARFKRYENPSFHEEELCRWSTNRYLFSYFKVGENICGSSLINSLVC